MSDHGEARSKKRPHKPKPGTKGLALAECRLAEFSGAAAEVANTIEKAGGCVWEKLGRACHDAGIVHVSPHSFRHSYRAWLDELGTPITVQQRAMRHGDIRVTMNYGYAIGEGLREASAKVAAHAVPQ
jgi:integrase